MRPFTDKAYRIGKIYFIKNSFKFDKMKGTKKSFWRYSSSENFHSNANDHYEHTNTNIMNQEGKIPWPIIKQHSTINQP